MTTEEFAQTCFDWRGYVVVGTFESLNIGSLHVLDDQPGTATDSKAVVTAKTNREDMVQQLEYMGEPIRINCPMFYRMVAE